MNETLKKIQENKHTVIVVIAILMLVFFGFGSAIDVAGKAQSSGIKLLFNGKSMPVIFGCCWYLQLLCW